MATDEILAKAIQRSAYKANKSYRLIPREDFEQHLWVFVLEDRERLGALTDGELAEALRRAAWKFRKDDERERRAVKAAAAGYKVEDEQYYSKGLLRQLISAWIDNGVQEHPPAGREMSPGSRSDPGTRGTWLAAMEDISGAMARIKPFYRNVLERYFAYPRTGEGRWTHEEVAFAMGYNPSTLKHVVSRALSALQRELGGANPWRKRDKIPPCCEGGTCPQHRQAQQYDMEQSRQDMEARRGWAQKKAPPA